MANNDFAADVLSKIATLFAPALNTPFKILPNGPNESAAIRDLKPDDIAELQLEDGFDANQELTRVLDFLSINTALTDGRFIVIPDVGDLIKDRWQVHSVSRPIYVQATAVRRIALIVYRPKVA